MKQARISEIEVFLPSRKVSSEEVELLANKNGGFVPAGSVARLFGVNERRYADEKTQVSDLATNAARPIVEKHGAQKNRLPHFRISMQ